ncbi:MAG TPA: type II secretion system F family protein [Alphaproteobacteria bacterium]|nr:type II secretion system F family protein [Alphaproteobacteria bacterium]
MEDIIALDSNIFVVLLSALAAAVSFVAFALPLLQRSEKRERYKDVIEKKRRALFDQAREQANNKGKKQEISQAQSMALFYRLQRLAGETSLSARNLVLQAGMRSPNAPIVYLVSRMVLPLVFMGLGMLVITISDKEIKNSLVLLILMSLALFGFFLPRILVKNTADKRQEEISLSFPDALDMMLICVQGGIGIEAAINRIADTVADHSEALAEEMGILSAELGMLNDRKAAFQGFAMRVGSGTARSFATAMLQAEQYGTSVSKAIRVLADESREMRMAAAEQKAAALPPKLTVPMILFFLPALFVVILGPAFIGGPPQ